MCEPAIHVLRSVFTRLVQQMLSPVLPHWGFVFFLRIHQRLASIDSIHILELKQG